MRAANVIAAVLVGTVTLVSARALADDDKRSAHDAPVVPKLIWTDCSGGFQCATAKVPLDYDRPSGRMIDIALVRRPAADPANRIGSLFLNPGGPGLSAIEFVRTAPPPVFPLFGQFDIVGFDPRGLGASQPAVLDCGNDPAYSVPMPRTSTVANKAFLAQARNYGETCRKINREILSHVSTANVVRDLDLLRAAVGDEKLNYFGVSYGSVIGATYASMFPGGRGGPAAMTAREALRLGTRGGAAVLGRDDIGSIEPGKCADLAVWRTDTLELGGAEDPVAGLVFSAPHRVDRLLVGGEDVVRGGALVHADEDEIARDHRTQARRFAS